MGPPWHRGCTPRKFSLRLRPQKEDAYTKMQEHEWPFAFNPVRLWWDWNQKKTPFQYRDTTFPHSVLSNTFGTTHWAINKSAWTLNRAHFLASCIHSLVSWMSLSGCWSFWSEIITSPLLGKLLIRQMSRFFTEPVDRLLCFARRLHLVTCKTPLLKTQFAPVRIAGTARLALAGRESWRKYPSARFKRFKGKLPGDCR